MRSPYFQPTFGQPNVFDPMGTCLAIEDVWPGLHIGTNRVEEMRRKVTQFDWGQTALQRWIREAETVLPDGGTWRHFTGRVLPSLQEYV